jgi:hypothetical protein
MIPNGAPYGKPSLYTLLDRLAVSIVVILVGVAAFGIGRLSATDSQKGTLIIHPPDEAASEAGVQGTSSQTAVH